MDDDVHPPERRAQRHVGALDVEPGGGLGRAGAFARVGVEPAAEPERYLPFRERVDGEVARPRLEDGIAADDRSFELVPLEDREEAGHGAVAVADDGEGLRLLGPPALEERGRLGALVLAGDRGDCVGVGLGRGLDGERLRAAREERLADDGVVDQVEHVGGVAPELGGSRLARLGTERAPGRAAVGAVPVRARAAQEAGDRVAHGLVDDEAVAASVDERQVEQAAQRLGAVLLLEHRREHGLSGPPHDRGRLQRAPRELVLHVFEVEARELIDDAGQRRVLERELRMLGDAGRGERERERMPLGDPVQARGFLRGDTALLEQRD